MSPTTHLLASWILAAKTTDNPRDCRLVALAGILPDLDGLGMGADLFNDTFRHQTTAYYQRYHHYWTHGLPGAIVVTAVLVCFARRRRRVALLAMVAFHLHLLCDFVGSRGPDVGDKWPIYYFGPLSQHPIWFCEWQWKLFGWQNATISLVLFVWATAIAMERGDSIIGVFNRRADAIFVAMLRKWRGALRVVFERRQ